MTAKELIEEILRDETPYDPNLRNKLARMLQKAMEHLEGLNTAEWGIAMDELDKIAEGE